jgi:hypothetical protein
MAIGHRPALLDTSAAMPVPLDSDELFGDVGVAFEG